ncbi:MAG: copper-binding protein [Ramlibacter sp.]|nr:copper-binding protein [Ramlibacter sp.]
MKKLIPALLLTFTSALATAQTANDMTDAEVRKIDKDNGKVTLRHGPIRNLDMPGMTMVFKVKDPAMLDKMAVGDRIRVHVEQDKGAMVVTRLEKAGN